MSEGARSWRSGRPGLRSSTVRTTRTRPPPSDPDLPCSRAPARPPSLSLRPCPRPSPLLPARSRRRRPHPRLHRAKRPAAWCCTGSKPTSTAAG
ncbi:Hypothetical protein I596_3573 [Dokdonella koreensis DS-123]|uniref:Uncharacterized protein n=1 Tax=Dokdonella koreensis DS-123 TaxID=1300342 RepID=A0A160DYN4_9GAMM|nr:Hypothetical protein I596_3573 [Dokdonella koreensis DS-123]